MKKLFYLLLISIFTFTGCNKDDDNKETPGGGTTTKQYVNVSFYNGTEEKYTVTGAFLTGEDRFLINAEGATPSQIVSIGGLREEGVSEDEDVYAYVQKGNNGTEIWNYSSGRVKVESNVENTIKGFFILYLKKQGTEDSLLLKGNFEKIKLTTPED